MSILIELFLHILQKNIKYTQKKLIFISLSHNTNMKANKQNKANNNAYLRVDEIHFHAGRRQRGGAGLLRRGARLRRQHVAA